jgi:hypothetical protein
LPSDSLENVFNPHTSSHGLSGAELTRLPLNALTSNQKSNCNTKPEWVFDWPDLSPVPDGGITSARLVSDLSDKF